MYRDFPNIPMDTVNIQDRPETIVWYNMGYDISTTLTKGLLVVEDTTTKKARAAVAADTYAMLCWTPSNMVTTTNQAQNKFDQSGMSPTITWDAGGIVAVVGKGTIINQDVSTFDTTIVGVTPVAGYPIIIGTSGAPAAVAVAAGGVWAFGKVLRVDGNIVTWLFTSDGVYYA